MTASNLSPTVCNRIEAELPAFLDGELDPEQRRAFERHIDECPSCAQLLAEAKRVNAPVADAAPANRPLGRPPRLVAAGFLGAFATSILTVVLTGLWVRSPDSQRESAAPAVSLALAESRTVNLVFASADALVDAALTIELPAGVEIADYAGRRRVGWNTHLHAGNNILPLTLVAREGRGGRLVARLQHGGKEKEFVVNVTIGFSREWQR